MMIRDRCGLPDRRRPATEAGQAAKQRSSSNNENSPRIDLEDRAAGESGFRCGFMYQGHPVHPESILADAASYLEIAF